MANPAQQSFLALSCMLTAVVGGCAIGYTVKEARSLQTVAAPSRATAQAPRAAAKSALAEAVRGCGANDLVACGRVAGRLESMFAGSDPGANAAADRTLAHALASATIVVIHEDAANPTGPVPRERRVLVSSLRSCAADDLVECERLAHVLGGLFTGSDVRLEQTDDGLLARAFARRLIAVAGNNAEAQIASAVHQ